VTKSSAKELKKLLVMHRIGCYLLLVVLWGNSAALAPRETTTDMYNSPNAAPKRVITAKAWAWATSEAVLLPPLLQPQTTAWRGTAPFPQACRLLLLQPWRLCHSEGLGATLLQCRAMPWAMIVEALWWGAQCCSLAASGAMDATASTSVDWAGRRRWGPVLDSDGEQHKGRCSTKPPPLLATHHSCCNAMHTQQKNIWCLHTD